MIPVAGIRIQDSKREDGICLVHVGGRVNIYSAEKLKKYMEQLAQKGETSFIVDMADTDYIDSSGVGALIMLSTLYNEKNSRIRFINFRGSIKKVIQLSGVVSLIPQCESLEEAVWETNPKTRAT